MASLNNHSELAKELGLKEAISIAVGAMIGGGIFTVMGRLAHLAGPFAVLSFMLGGIIAFLTSTSYVKLISKYPSAGGEFVILRRAFKNPLFGNTIGALLWLGYSVTIALYAFTFGLYTSEFMYEYTGNAYFSPENMTFFGFRRLMAALAILTFMAINLKGVKETGTIQNVIVSFKLGVLVLLAVVGAFFVKGYRYEASYNALVAGNNEMTAIFNGVFVGGAIIFVSYEGFQVIANTVEEMKNPARDVRLGMYISVIIVALTYMSVSWVTIGLVDGEISEAALIQAVAFLGPIAVTLITLGAIASTTSAINATLLGSSRLAYVMSDWKAFPKKLAVISKSTKVPYLAIIITSTLSLSFTFLGDAAQIAEVGSIIFLGIFLSINYSAIKVYKNEKNIASITAVVLIVIDIILAFYYLIFIEGIENTYFTFVVLTLFVVITLIWMIGTQISMKEGEISAEGYILEPLGIELIQEFQPVDQSDLFFLDLERILIPVSGDPHESRNIFVAAMITRKYGIKSTILHIGKNKDKIKHVLDIFDEYNIDYELIVKDSKDVAQEIINTYREGDYQLIALSSRRKPSWISHLFEKSVSKEVVNNVDCAVLQVHPPKYGQRKIVIGDLLLLLDGTERDYFLVRWAKLLSSVSEESKVYAYHVLELPSIFPLDEAPKVEALKNSQQRFEKYVFELSERFGMDIIPVFLYGHSFIKAVASAVQRKEPDTVLIGRTKDKGFFDKFRTPRSYQIMKKLDSTVIVQHMPDIKKNGSQKE